MNAARHAVRAVACLVLTGCLAISSAATALAGDASRPDPNAYQPSSVPVGAMPKGVAAAGDVGFVANFGGQSVTPFSACIPKTCEAVPATAIPAGQQPSGVAALVQNGRGTAYVSNSASGTITVLGYQPGYGPLVDAPSTVVVGGQPTGIAVSPRGDRAYIADNQRDLLLVMDTNSRSVIASIPVPDGPWGVAVTPDAARVYVASTSANVVSAIDTASLAIVRSIPGQGLPANIAIDANGSTGYVTNNGGDSISVLNIGTNEIVGTIQVGSQPWGVLATPSAVFVANYGSASVSVIDPQARTVIATIRTGTQPFGLAWDSRKVFVTNAGSGTLSSIPLAAPTGSVAWSRNAVKRTITGRISASEGIAVTMVARSGSTVRRGTCTRDTSTGQVTCTIAVPKGTWSASVQTRLPWQPTPGGWQNRRFTF